MNNDFAVQFLYREQPVYIYSIGEHESVELAKKSFAQLVEKDIPDVLSYSDENNDNNVPKLGIKIFERSFGLSFKEIPYTTISDNLIQRWTTNVPNSILEKFSEFKNRIDGFLESLTIETDNPLPVYAPTEKEQMLTILSDYAPIRLFNSICLVDEILYNMCKIEIEEDPILLKILLSDDEEENLYQAAIEFIESGGNIEYQALQRRFNINFASAQRLIKRLESKGYIEIESLPNGIAIRTLIKNT